MQKESKWDVLIIEPQKQPCQKTIDTTLLALQTEIGCSIIQQISPFQDCAVILCNDEGKILNLPYNRALFDKKGEINDVICGTFLIIGTKGDSYTSLSEHQIEKYTKQFQKIEMFFPETPYTQQNNSLKQLSSHSSQKRRFEIYQLTMDNSNPVAKLMRFMNFEYLQKNHFTIDSINYTRIYTGFMEENDTLSDIFYRFNVAIPSDYYGHSLSVSDVVVITENGKKTAYFVDSYDYKEIPDFFTQEETVISFATENKQIRGISGLWQTVEQITVSGANFFLMKRLDAPVECENIIVNTHGEIILQHITDIDDRILRVLKNEVTPVKRMPDDSITIHQMKNYGHSWGGMLPIRAKRAHELFPYLRVYRLNDDDTEAVIDTEDMIDELSADGVMFGVDKIDWCKLWESTDESQKKKLFPTAAEPI